MSKAARAVLVSAGLLVTELVLGALFGAGLALAGIWILRTWGWL